jgi:hypothetical protein
MDYFEKRKIGTKRIAEKIASKFDEKEKLETKMAYPVAMKNDFIMNYCFKNLKKLRLKKLLRIVVSMITKESDTNTTFIIRHKDIQKLLKDNFTSVEIFEMLEKISSSFSFYEKNEYVSIPMFKIIRTSEDHETTNIIFNEFFSGLLFFNGNHFLKYDLSSILNYKYLYSIELFEILLCNVRLDQRNEIVPLTYDIKWLKKKLDCSDMRTNDFIKRVIDKSINELNKYNKSHLGGTIKYKYNKLKSEITFFIENVNLMLKNSKKDN